MNVQVNQVGELVALLSLSDSASGYIFLCLKRNIYIYICTIPTSVQNQPVFFKTYLPTAYAKPLDFVLKYLRHPHKSCFTDLIAILGHKDTS